MIWLNLGVQLDEASAFDKNLFSLNTVLIFFADVAYITFAFWPAPKLLLPFAASLGVTFVRQQSWAILNHCFRPTQLSISRL